MDVYTQVNVNCLLPIGCRLLPIGTRIRTRLLFARDLLIHMNAHVMDTSEASILGALSKNLQHQAETLKQLSERSKGASGQDKEGI